MHIRTCSKCGKTGQPVAFAKFRHRDGRIGRRNVCLECRASFQIENFEKLKKYRQEYNKNNRTKKAIETEARRNLIKDIINKIKNENPCTDCGNFFPAVAMDFDHVKHKGKGIATMVSQSYKIDLILEEIKLCEIVCACCHRIRTHSRKQNHAPRKVA